MVLLSKRPWADAMKTTLLFCVATLCLAGTRPRQTPQDYKSHESVSDIIVAAEVVPRDQVKNLFSADLKKYVVVEVAVYPSGSQPLTLQMSDFTLRCGSQTVRAALPQAVPHALHGRDPQLPSDVAVYTTGGVGYESGPYGHGVSYGGGVGVATGPGVGGPRPGPDPRDRDAIQYELQDKGLPEGPVARPVAGYLYFPFPSNKQKSVAYELQYDGDPGHLRLNLK